MLEEDVLKFLRDFFAVEAKTSEDFKELFTSLDSLDTLDLAYQIEERFNIRIDNNAKIHSVDDLVKLIDASSAAA